MPTRFCAAIVVSAVLTAAAEAQQCSWVQDHPASMVPDRGSTAIAYDVVRDRVVLFGGTPDGLLELDDTWEWDGRRWTERFPTHRPPGRWSVEMCYDAARGEMVMFGGSTFATGDTWTWDGGDWIQHSPSTLPHIRTLHELVYDSVRQRVVMFGGNNGGALADTWEWDGVDWTQRFPAHSPPGRWSHMMAFDGNRGRAVLFGGRQAGGVFSNDTWEWDGTDWTLASPATRPPAHGQGTLVYEAHSQRVVLYSEDQNWDWDGTDWTLRSPLSIPFTYHPTLAYDSVRGRIMMLRNHGAARLAQWQFHCAQTLGGYEPFGDGCAGSVGTPHLAAQPGDLPFLGDGFTACVADLPANQPLLMGLGFSRTRFWLLNLPAELASFQMPGCYAYADVVEAMLLTSSGGEAEWSVAVPGTPPLVGLEFYNQAYVHDPTANARGWITSNAAAGVIGLR